MYPKMNIGIVALAGVFSLAFSAHAEKQGKISLHAVNSPAWSLHHSPRELVVSVSPTRQTLQLFGSAGLLIGSSVSAVVDDKYRVKVYEVLGDYDAGAVFEERLKRRIETEMGARLTQVGALTGMGNHTGVAAARSARMAELTAAGHEVLLDLVITYGIFGSEGLMVTRIDGDLFRLPGGKDIWRNTIVCSPAPILADDATGDPTSRFSPSFSKLGVDSAQIEKWLQDDGAILRARFEAAVDGAVSALLCDLKLADDAEGHYYLGKAALASKNYGLALAHFTKALEQDTENLDYANGLAVAHAQDKNIEKAIDIAKGLLQKSPGYGPAHYNLAWWYATEYKEAEAAQTHYDKAVALGMPANKKIGKFLKKNG